MGGASIYTDGLVRAGSGRFTTNVRVDGNVGIGTGASYAAKVDIRDNG